MCVDKVFGDKVCVDKVCGDKVCVDKVCGDKVYVDKVCVDKVWRRAEEEKAEEEPGIQNQKQEPHTKMWGKTTSVRHMRSKHDCAVMWGHEV